MSMLRAVPGRVRLSLNAAPARCALSACAAMHAWGRGPPHRCRTALVGTLARCVCLPPCPAASLSVALLLSLRILPSLDSNVLSRLLSSAKHCLLRRRRSYAAPWCGTADVASISRRQASLEAAPAAAGADACPATCRRAAPASSHRLARRGPRRGCIVCSPHALWTTRIDSDLCHGRTPIMTQLCPCHPVSRIRKPRLTAPRAPDARASAPHERPTARAPDRPTRG
jgi:hypothetical protein